MRHPAQDGVRQNAALFANGAARKTAIFFVFSDMRASTNWLLRCAHRNPLGRSAGDPSLFLLGLARVLSPPLPPLLAFCPRPPDPPFATRRPILNPHNPQHISL